FANFTKRPNRVSGGLEWACCVSGRSAIGHQELILKRATRITPSGELKHDDYDVLCDDKLVGRIMKAAAAPVGTPWLWTFTYGAHRDYSTTYGYAADREEALKALAKAWRGIDRARQVE